MKDHGLENQMTLPSAEDVSMPTPEFIREIPQLVKHKFPLTTRIQAAINEYYDDNVDVDTLIELLKECQVTIHQADANFKALSDGIDTFLERIDAIKEQAE